MNDSFKWVVKTGITALASTNPILSAIAVGWDEYSSSQEEKNIKEVLSIYAEKVKKIENQIDIIYFESSQNKMLLEKTLNIGKNEVSEEKRKMLSEFLANSSTFKLSKDTEKVMTLDTISKMTPLQCKILEVLTRSLVCSSGKENVLIGSGYNPDLEANIVVKYFSEKDLVDHFKTVSTIENTEAVLDYMLAIGIIETNNSRGWTHLGNKSGVRGFRPSKLGLKVLEYLGVSIETLEN